MMIPQMLTPELSINSSMARSRTGARMAVLCLSGLLGTAVACSGSIDDNQDVASSRPTTSDTANGRGAANPSSPVGASSETANAADDTDPSDISTRERGATDDILGVSGGSRASGAGRRGGGSRASDLENTPDAGEVDAGDADAGEADTGEVDTDAGSIEADTGLGDGGAAPL
jgi:hypothetical protein